MDKFWLITWHEYSRHVLRKRFIFALLSVPFFITLMIGMVLLVMRINSDPKPIGYIDHSGLLDNPISQPRAKFPEHTIPMHAYRDEASAKADLQAGKLQVFYIIPADYLETGKAEQVYLKPPKGINTQQFDSFLRVNLLKSQPAEIANRILDGNHLLIESPGKNSEGSENRAIYIILPFIIGILFIVGMSTTSGYLMQAMVEEKENRTMEIMMTSVSPMRLMSGKIVADVAVGATQLIVWAIFILMALVIGKSYLPFLSGFVFPTDTLILLSAVMVPAFIMIAGLMAAVGATITQASEGQQVMGLFTIPIWLPYIFIGTFLRSPNSPLAIGMSFFPLTAPMTIALRIGLTTIPTWQLILSITILVLSALGSVWFAARAFRLGMLRYGQRLRWSEILKRQNG